MKKRTIYIGSFILTVILLNSCTPPKYIPNVLNTPMLSNTGEIQASMHIAVSGFDPQLAFAVTDNLGLMVNGSFYSDETSSIDNDYHKHNFVEFGAGYYATLGKIGRFETFGGYGYGKLRDYDYDSPSGSNYFIVSSTRYFLQPSIGMTTKIFDANAAWRCAIVNLYEDSEHYRGIFLEPVVTLKLGYKHVKSKIQLGFSLPFTEADLGFSYQPFIFSFGVQINIGRYWE